MRHNEYQNELIDFFYGEIKTSLEKIAVKYNEPLKKCEDDFRMIEMISQRFREMPDYSPHSFTVNRILAHAREKARESKKKTVWFSFLHPAYSLVAFLFIGVLLFISSELSMLPSNHQNTLAKTDQLNTRTLNLENVSKRLFSTPFDRHSFGVSDFYPKQKKSSPFLISNVSSGLHVNQFDIDDDLEQKMFFKSPGARDVETLYFRARKMEKLGYFQEALNDYQVINNLSSDSDYQPSIPLAMARCYEKLGNKGAAVSILENYKTTFGGNEDIEIWIDQLKSETF